MAIPEISPREAHQRQQQGALLVDVREDHERELGMAEGARGIARAELEEDPTFHFPDRDAELVLICQSGGRSMLAAEVLQGLGYRSVSSVRGGTSRWIAEGFPTSRPAAEIDHDFHDRYSRHLLLPEVGVRGQKRLESARMLLIGAGGLGSPAAFYLAAAGVVAFGMLFRAIAVMVVVFAVAVSDKWLGLAAALVYAAGYSAALGLQLVAYYTGPKAGAAHS